MDLLSKQSDWKFADVDRRAMTRLLRACAFSIVVAAGLASPVEWPDRSFARADSPVAIGVIGADALADELAQIVSGRNVNGRPVLVRKLRPSDPIAGLHVLFIGRVDRGRLAEILAAAKGQALLTVTESEEGLELGSMINFVVVENKVRFDVAPPPSESDNLKISARLLGVARKVVPRSS